MQQSEMTSQRRFCCDDMFAFNGVNLDVLTETVRALRCHARAHPPHSRCISRDAIAAPFERRSPARSPARARERERERDPRFPSSPPSVLTPPAQYNTSFYAQYLGTWPDYCAVMEGPRGEIMGYSTLPPRLRPPRINR